MNRPLVEVRNLTKHFVISRSWSGRPLEMSRFRFSI